MFKAMLRQEIGWFDSDDNTTGVLVGTLSEDGRNVQSVRKRRLLLLYSTITIHNFILFVTVLAVKKNNYYQIVTAKLVYQNEDYFS